MFIAQSVSTSGAYVTMRSTTSISASFAIQTLCEDPGLRVEGVIEPMIAAPAIAG